MAAENRIFRRGQTRNKNAPLKERISYHVTDQDDPTSQEMVEPSKRRSAIMSAQAIRKEKTMVRVRAVFLKMGEIDTAKEFFTAEVFIQAKWREQYFDDKEHSVNKKDVKWDMYWNPRLLINNTHGELKETIWNTLIYEGNRNEREAYICERRRIKGAFIEKLELQEFPFDTQDLTVTVVSERTMDEMEFEVDHEPSAINCEAFVDEQEWQLHNFITANPGVIGKIYQESGKVHHPSMDFSCQASRRFGFFFWNVFVVLFFICSMTFTTFSVVYTRPENRIQLTFILLLTSVTFRITVNNNLPKFSYLTFMDVYIISAMIFQCLICMWHAIVGGALVQSPIPPEKAFWADKWVLVSLAIFYILYNVIFFSYIAFKMFNRRKQQKQQMFDQMARTKTILGKAFYTNSHGGVVFEKDENNV